MKNKQCKKYYIWALALTMICASTQAQDWKWGISGGGGGPQARETILDMATDPHGNVYALTEIEPFGQFDGIPIRVFGQSKNMLVFSYDCEGGLRWYKQIGGGEEGLNMAVGLGLDSMGGVYVAGIGTAKQYYMPGRETFQFDNDTIIVDSTFKRTFLIKYDTSGNFQWLSMPEPDHVNHSRRVRTTLLPVLAMETDLAGDTYLFVQSRDSGTLAASNIQIPDTNMQYHILKIDKNGQPVDFVHLDIETPWGPTGRYVPMGSLNLARDPNNGNFYLSGHYQFPDPLNPYELFMGGRFVKPGAVVAAFDAQGTYLWHRTNAGRTFSFNGRPQIDEQGNIILTALFLGNSIPGHPNNDTFNGYEITNCYVHHDGPYTRYLPFIVKLSPSGQNIWAINACASVNHSSYSIALKNNTVIIGGDLFDTLFWPNSNDTLISQDFVKPVMFAFNQTTGEYMYTGAINSLDPPPSGNSITALAFGQEGNIYAGGNFKYQIIIDGDTLTSTGGRSDFFLAKYGQACNCEPPVAGFSHNNLADASFDFNTNNPQPEETYEWDFGDGSQKSDAQNPRHTFPAPGSYKVCLTVTNECGTDTHCDTITVKDVGIAAATPFGKVKIYPNPTQNRIYLSNLQEGMQYLLYTSLGEAIRKGKFENTQASISMQQLATGWYILELQDKNGQKGRYKVIKK